MTLIRRLILVAVLMAGFSPAIAQSPAPVPALPDTERRTSYSITSSTCACAVNFALYGDSTDYQNWIEVWLNGARVSYNDASLGWTITSPSGSLATLARPISNAVLTFNQVQTGTVQIVGARRPRRTSQVSESQGVAARAFNQAITDLVAQNREVWDKINDVTGRAVLAPPGETLAILASATSRASQGACFDSGGNLVACVSVPSSTFTAGNGIALTGVNPTTITNNIQASAPIVISGTNPLTVSCPTCNTAPATASPAVFLATRAAAVALDLHTYSVVRTGGYSVAGDVGGALFKNVGSSPFLDSFVTAGTLTAPGSAYTNSTYLGVSLTGGTGTGLVATVTVAGGVVTGVAITGTGGNGYTVGDVLSATAASIGGTGSGFTWTVSTVTTPTGSFTDSVGTHFQIVADPYVTTKQFGAACNYTTSAGDAGATNDTTTIQNALNFASGIRPPTVDAGGTAGLTVLLPACASLVSSLQIPFGVTFQGQGRYSSLLKVADSLSAASHFITLCDPNTHLACFGTRIQKMMLFPGSGAANASISMIYSNNVQQMDAVQEVFMFSGKRACIYWDIGYGGAASVGVSQVECLPNNTSTNPGIIPNYGAAVQTFRDIIVETSAWSGNGILVAGTAPGGIIVVDGFHSEGIVSPIFVNLTAANAIVHVKNATGGAGCTSLITRQTGSAANVVKAGALIPNGCTNTTNNAGATVSGNILADVTF